MRPVRLGVAVHWSVKKPIDADLNLSSPDLKALREAESMMCRGRRFHRSMILGVTPRSQDHLMNLSQIDRQTSRSWGPRSCSQSRDLWVSCLQFVCTFITRSDKKQWLLGNYMNYILQYFETEIQNAEPTSNTPTLQKSEKRPTPTRH